MWACWVTPPPFSLPRAYLLGRPAVCCGAAGLSVCRVVLQIPRAQHARLVAVILARMLMLRGNWFRGIEAVFCEQTAPCIVSWQRDVWRSAVSSTHATRLLCSTGTHASCQQHTANGLHVLTHLWTERGGPFRLPSPLAKVREIYFCLMCAKYGAAAVGWQMSKTVTLLADLPQIPLLVGPGPKLTGCAPRLCQGLVSVPLNTLLGAGCLCVYWCHYVCWGGVSD